MIILKSKGLDYWKKKLISILKGDVLEKSLQEILFPGILVKSLPDETKNLLVKAKAYPAGTIREWGGKKYKKLSSGKWMRTYTGTGERGERQAVRIVMNKIQKAESMAELAKIVSENMQRFRDENGKTLPVVKEFMAAARGTKSGEKQKDKYPNLPKVERSFTVQGIGRKYIKISYPGRSNTYDLEKDESLKDVKAGDTISGVFAEDKNTSKYGTTVKYYLISTRDSEEIKKKSEDIHRTKEISRWTEYVENASEKGYIYEKGINELKKNGYEDFPDIKERVDRAISNVRTQKVKNEINRWMGYIKENINQYWYSKGEDKVNYFIKELDKIGVDTNPYKDKLKELVDSYSQMKKQKKEQETKQKYGDQKIIKISQGSGYGGFPYTQGTVVKAPANISKDGTEYLYVIESSKKYIKDDGLSFGVGDDSGYIYSAVTRPATEEESSGIKEYANEKESHNERIKQIRGIEKTIENNGEIPRGENTVQGDEYLNSFNIYGSGSKIVINKDEIWYIQNNGMDGDDWSANNVKTGGAGAIGWKIPYDKEIANKIIKISEEENKYKEYIKNAKGNEDVFPVALKKSRIIVR